MTVTDRWLTSVRLDVEGVQGSPGAVAAHLNQVSVAAGKFRVERALGNPRPA